MNLFQILFTKIKHFPDTITKNRIFLHTVREKKEHFPNTISKIESFSNTISNRIYSTYYKQKLNLVQIL